MKTIWRWLYYRLFGNGQAYLSPWHYDAAEWMRRVDSMTQPIPIFTPGQRVRAIRPGPYGGQRGVIMAIVPARPPHWPDNEQRYRVRHDDGHTMGWRESQLESE